MWWVIGGYYVSSYLFVTADLINQFIVTFPPDTESIVGELLLPVRINTATVFAVVTATCMLLLVVILRLLRSTSSILTGAASTTGHITCKCKLSAVSI
jgi:hypothetical protein